MRYICAQLGLTPIVWTSVGGVSYGASTLHSTLRRKSKLTPHFFKDTQDWQIVGGTVPVAKVLNNFETIINGSSKLDNGEQ